MIKKFLQKIVKSRNKLCFCLCFLLGTNSFLYAQFTVSGTVTSGSENIGLPGVNIVVQGTTQGTVTDIEGNYNLEAPEDGVLVFSSIGFISEEVPVNGRSRIDVSLMEDITTLDEIVVVGYGTQRERDLTSAITTIRSEEILKTPTSQAMQSLQGKVAGVQIVSSGEPGRGPTVRVRGVGSLTGVSDPLYVVDGMFFDNLDWLNPSDIETMSVLKDASAAAIYGVRAANGVVLIETKSGSYNQPAEIVYDGYYGVQVPQNVLKMANAQQFSQYVRETGAAADASFLDRAMQRFGRSRIDPNIPDVNTDWYDEVLQTAPIQNHSMGISGGGDRARYSVGASYFEQKGILQETRNEYERFTFRTKVDFKVKEWLNVGGNVNLSNGTRFEADNSVWFNTYFAVPIIPVYDELNTAATPVRLSNARNIGYRDAQNPYYNLLYNDNRIKETQILGNFHADFDLIENKLTFRTAYNYSFGSINQRDIDFGYNDGTTIIQAGIRKDHITTLNQIWDNILTYQESFDRHHLTVMGGYSFRSETGDELYARGSGFDNPPDRNSEQYWYISRGGIFEGVGDADTGDENRNNFGSFYGVSYLGRIAYNYNDRYLIYGTFRREGTSKFQQKWGNFPTIGLGWVVSEENFFNMGFIDFLKIRGSWGLLGNDGIPSAIGRPYVDLKFTAINDQRMQGSIPIVNFDYLDRWETTRETNVGITSRFLNNRLALEADYYVRDTEHAALRLLLPLDRTSIRQNIGEIRNSGIELALNWADKLSNGLTYSIGGNIATLQNEVRDLGPLNYLNAGQAEFRQRAIVGQPLNAFFGYEVEGVFQNDEQIANSGYTQEYINDRSIAPGDFIYKDQNGDGVVDDKDRVVLGSYLPNLTYGFNFGLNYKNFDLTANFQGQSGHKIVNRKRGQIIFTTDANLDAELVTNLWRGEGTSNKYPSAAGLRKPYNQEMSEYFVEDGSYFRIQNVRLSYNVIGKSLLGASMPDIRVTFTAERPLTVFNYNGFNPEVASGVDIQTYPIPGIYTLGLNIKL